MLRQAFPIDSHVEYETDGTPIYDRAITSAPLRKFIKSLATDGVLPNPSTNLQVSAGTGMNVLVEAGFALCNGCMALEESQRTLAVQAADTSYDRIDTVVIRLNDNDSERTCDLYVLQGVAASSPVRPTLTRTESIWEIGLADLFITPNSSEITNQRITDTRYETERCGIISAISEFDTTTLYNQIQADLAGFKEEEQAQFVEWFEYMKDQLSEDAAGNLQLQIDATNEKVGLLENLKTTVKTSIVAAINWIVDQINTLNNNLANTNKDVSALNSKYEECFQSVSNGKSLVASAITDKGVTTELDATFETMAQNIETIPVGKFIALGNGTSWNVKSICEQNGIDYTKLTTSNFACGMVSVGAVQTDGVYTTNVAYKPYARADGMSSFSYSYNASTGVLSVSGNSQSIRLRQTDSNSTPILASNTQTFTCRAWLLYAG